MTRLAFVVVAVLVCALAGAGAVELRAAGLARTAHHLSGPQATRAALIRQGINRVDKMVRGDALKENLRKAGLIQEATWWSPVSHDVLMNVRSSLGHARRELSANQLDKAAGHLRAALRLLGSATNMASGIHQGTAEKLGAYVTALDAAYKVSKVAVDAALAGLAVAQAHPLVDILEWLWGSVSAYTDSILEGKSHEEAMASVGIQAVMGSVSSVLRIGAAKHASLPSANNLQVKFKQAMEALSNKPAATYLVETTLPSLPKVINTYRNCRAKKSVPECKKVAFSEFVKSHSQAAVSGAVANTGLSGEASKLLAGDTFAVTFMWKLVYEPVVNGLTDSSVGVKPQ